MRCRNYRPRDRCPCREIHTRRSGLLIALAAGLAGSPVVAAPGSQPGLKVRGREYLRIIYGPDYAQSLDIMRDRHLGKKRQLESEPVDPRL